MDQELEYYALRFIQEHCQGLFKLYLMRNCGEDENSCFRLLLDIDTRVEQLEAILQ